MPVISSIDEIDVELPLLGSEGAIGGDHASHVEISNLHREASSQRSVRSGLAAGIANMSNSIIGAGIIGLPLAIAEAGFFTGIFLLVVLCGVTDWTIRLIVINSKLSGTSSYMGIMEYCFGRPGQIAVSTFQFVFACGGMAACAYLTNVTSSTGDTIPHVLASLLPQPVRETGLGAMLVNRQFIIALAIGGVAYPLSLYRDISKLAKASSLAVLSMLVIVLSVVIRGPQVDPELKGSRAHVFTVIGPKVFEAIGVISFAYVCHHNSMLIYGSLERPTLDRFSAVTHISTLTSLICCLILSISGYLVFTDKTQGNILNCFDEDDAVINVARLCFGLNMFTTLPLEVFVCREVIENLLERPFNYTRHWLVTTGLVFSAMLVSMTTCDLGIVLELTGGLSATALAFLFPAACYYSLLSEPWYGRRKLCAAACTIFGIVVMVLSVILALQKLYTGAETANKACS
ncbi:hypothetical protein FFLO_01405 [Filobasidium floriforme]|uniref:Amino acid transporter transmembrane domain-containing protein n=1 Tax=Filobasidium floriforme TaxID=5210 RepID=A0A8K0JQN5_9TREE|nr:hypothetical protein FFLO_01405 [Filobasidium floriforme]